MAHGQLKVCRALAQVDDGDNEITKDEFVEVVAKLKLPIGRAARLKVGLFPFPSLAMPRIRRRQHCVFFVCLSRRCGSPA